MSIISDYIRAQQQEEAQRLESEAEAFVKMGHAIDDLTIVHHPGRPAYVALRFKSETQDPYRTPIPFDPMVYL